MGISPLRVFRAMSLIERTFARENPARRILRASMVAMSSGPREAPPGKERDEAAQDRLGGPPVDLLVGDRAHQRLEGLLVPDREPAGPHAPDERAHHRVHLGEMPERGAAHVARL